MPPKVPRAAAVKAPAGWQALYNSVLAMRQRVTTPVDVIGCDRLSDSTDPEVTRFQTLVALMLSAQTRDYFTAEAMASLQNMPKGLSAQTLAGMTEPQIVERIKCVGMYNGKAKHLKAASARILKDYAGHVPSSIDELLTLPGVGPKMAHLFMQCADGKNTGIGVDVHVHRIVQRWNWVPKSVKTPEDSRVALEAWLPQKHWPEINEILVGFGQSICTPRLPKCHLCAAQSLCPNAFKENPAAKKIADKTAVDAKKASPLTRQLSGKESPDDLLALCGGSSEELLARGWLEKALPPVKVPPSVLQRRASLSAATDKEEQRPTKAHRSELQAEAAKSSGAPLDRRLSWQLADVEDLVASTATAVKGKSKYFH